MIPFLLLFALALFNATASLYPAESHFDHLNLPPLMGVSWAEFQNSGTTLQHCQWNRWQHLERPGNPTIKDHQHSGPSADHWHRFKEDLQLAQHLGVNACRFSIDWSMIEPEEGKFNHASLAHYHEEIDEMLKLGMTPMVTMHHFAHPTWFEDRGGFEHLSNLYFFKRFCSRIFQEYQKKVKLWCIINEPGPYTFQGYLNQAFPPGLCHPVKAGIVLRNLLLFHVDTYNTLKAMPGGADAKIGFVHQYLPFESFHSNNPIELIPARALNYIFNDCILDFLKTGRFTFEIPLYASISIPDAVQKTINLTKPPFCDFIGLNFYSHVVVQQQCFNLLMPDAVVPGARPGEIMTDMPYPLYGPGLYEAIKTMSAFNVPLYITENGIADHNDTRRKKFFADYLKALSQARIDGYDVQGWFYWSLMDNFEWNDGFGPRFGLYAVDFATQQRTLRPSGKIFQAILANHFKTNNN